jgi:hypothetical protein
MVKRKDDDGPEVSTMNDTPDAEDPRTFEHPAADAVREGNLSAAQLPEGHGGVDPSEPDAQYPPGVIQNTATTSPEERQGVNPEAFVPERKSDEGGRMGFRTTDANPDYSDPDQ